MNKKLLKLSGWGSALALALPMVASAQDIRTLLGKFQTLITQIIPIIIGLGAVLFLWGVIEFVSAAGDEDKRSTGRQHMIWGIVGLAVMIGFWGLVNALLGTFGLANPNIPTPPTLPPIN